MFKIQWFPREKRGEKMLSCSENPRLSKGNFYEHHFIFILSFVSAVESFNFLGMLDVKPEDIYWNKLG